MRSGTGTGTAARTWASGGRTRTPGTSTAAAGATPGWGPNAEAEAPALHRKRPGYVRVLSSKGGVRFDLRPRAEDSATFGLSLARFPDADDDGLDDLLVAKPDAGSPQASIRLFSMKAGALLRCFDRPGRWSDEPPTGRPRLASLEEDSSGVPREINVGFGTRLLAVSDRDGDGRADVLVAVPQFFCFVPAGVLSSRTGRPLGAMWVERSDWVWRPDYDLCYLGLGACSPPDMDGDAVEDFAIGGGPVFGGSEFQGSAVIGSGKHLRALRYIIGADLRR